MFRNLYIKTCDEGIVLRCGPGAGGSDSGCWYNDFSAIHIYNCLRGVWLKDCPAGSSGVNRNYFHQMRIGQGCNTGIQIDDGTTNVFTEVHLEGIQTGTSPNATPTAIKIANTGASGLDNNTNVFNACMLESVSRSLENANASSEFYACEFGSPYSMVLTAVPRVFAGGDPSLQPSRLPRMFYSAGPVVGSYTVGVQYLEAEFGVAISAAGAYTFATDENTGIRRGGADEVQIFTGGSTRAQVTAAGINVPTGHTYAVNGQSVVGARGAALPADATDLATAITLVNAIKARMVAHGLVA